VEETPQPSPDKDALKELLKDILGAVNELPTCVFCGEEFYVVRKGQMHCTITCELMHFELRNGIGILPNEAYERCRLVDEIGVADTTRKKEEIALRKQNEKYKRYFKTGGY
jgi:hypothetical protein